MKKRLVQMGLIGCLSLLMGGCSAEQLGDTEFEALDQDYWIENYVQDLNYPWSITWLPNGDLLVTERLGEIKVIRNGVVVGNISGVPEVMAASPYDGLLDIKLDPDFEDNSYVYLSYTRGAATARIGSIFRGRLKDNQLVDGQTIFSTDPAAPTGGPNITRLKFLADKSLLAAVGSSGNSGSGMVQRVDGHIGKVVRLYRDGSIPDDNMFARNNPGARPEIWATGLRSIGGFAVDDEARLWALDIGPQGGDELNVLEPGNNYGWPLVTWGFDYSGTAMSDKQMAPGFIDPLVVWSPSLAPSGITYYRGDQFPQWQGDFFIGALADQTILRLRFKDDKLVHQERLLPELNERIRSVETGPDGFLYAVTDSPNGKILRVRPGQPLSEELARVAQPFDMPKKTTIYERLVLHGVMQDEETSEIEKAGYDPERAKFLYAQNCASCHSFGEHGGQGIGPDLNGVRGRPSGSLPGYAYSTAMGNPDTSIVWTFLTITAFLTNPKGYYPGTKMAAAPLSYADALQVTLYLSDGVAFK